MVLDNGLVSRTIDLGSGTTVAFDNHMTGETVIRAASPEGSVTIDGTTHLIGGLDGQPNRAFLTPEFLAAMKPTRGALVPTGHEIGATQPRMKWTRTRHHAPGATWPPQGRYLRLDYGAPEPSPDDVLTWAVPASDFGRPLVFADSFESLDASWKAHVSRAHPRSSFMNEGKPGEIYTPANTAVYVERPFPAGAELVEASLLPGTDRSASWAPGLGLVYPEGVIKFTLREGDKLCVTANGREHLGVNGEDRIDVSQEWTLRMRLVAGHVLFDARPAGGAWKNHFRLRAPGGGTPDAVRVGKMDKSGGGTDHQDRGDLVRLKINRVAIHGPFDPTKLAALQGDPPLKGIRVSVHYELYDGVPVMSKWITVHNASGRAITVDRFTSEMLAVVEHDSWVETRDGVRVPMPRVLHVETDYRLRRHSTHRNANRHVVHWRTDPTVLHPGQLPAANALPAGGRADLSAPTQTVAPGETFESFRAFELVHDSTDRERRGLALRRMYRTIAPWVTENPLMMHVRCADPDAVAPRHRPVRRGRLRDGDPDLRQRLQHRERQPRRTSRRWKEIADYARSQGHRDRRLLAARPAAASAAATTWSRPQGKRPHLRQLPGPDQRSGGRTTSASSTQFFEQTGFDLLEHDGSYPGDVDVTARPPLQKGLRRLALGAVADHHATSTSGAAAAAST